jgi:DNA (cytosine-5)-methyltransferase 1
MKLPLIIDNFAGGGGASTGIEAATGRPVDVAINHDEAAVAVHAANHPGTRHYCQSIFSVDPLDATGGAPVLLAWFSPDCKHHSKAKGGKPRDRNIRDMAWVVPHWIERLQRATPGGQGAPTVIMLENVEEFRQWGPLDDAGMPIKERQGEEFALWVRRIRRLGYKVEHRELRACDYGAPTSRKRLFLIARRDGRPIVWPAPTNGRPDSAEVRAGKLQPWRTAAECIDWSLPCPSIFDRKRPLKDATCRRIAAGVMRYVVRSARPFIVPVTHTSNGATAHSIDEPVRTVTTARGGELATVSPFFARTAHGEQDRSGKRRGRGDHSVEEAFPTVTASQDSALVEAVMVPHVMTNRNAGKPHTAIDEPTHTITAEGAHQNLVTTNFVSLDGGAALHPADHSSGEEERCNPVSSSNLVSSSSCNAPTKKERLSVAPNTPTPNPTTTSDTKPLTDGRSKVGGQNPPSRVEYEGGGTVAAFMHKYRPNSDGGPADAPMPTVTANSFVKRGGGAPPLAITSAHLEQANSERNGGVKAGRAATLPLSTVTSSGSHQRLVETTMVERDALPPELMERAVQVAAFLVKYYGSQIGQHQAADQPIDTVTAKARFAVITVTIDAVTFVLVDIGMRMLTPRELANAQGFPRDYVLDPVCWYETDGGNRKYGPLPKSHQIAKIGNSVCPAMSEALVRANLPEHCAPRVASQQGRAA